MSYYPKAKILENQYTSGMEYQRVDNNQPYIGTYCILSDGRFFSGKTLLNTSIELIRMHKTQKNIFPSTFISGGSSNRISFLNNLSKKQELRPTLLTPTEQDYKRGFITRYFAKKLNIEGIQIFEITQSDYNSINVKDGKYFDIYQVISLDWKITGRKYDDYSNNLMPIYGIVDTNRRTLEIKEKEMQGLKKYFENRLTEFAK